MITRGPRVADGRPRRRHCNDPDIHILCELIGGVEPAHDYVLRAIRSGKNIVTANKEMMAKAGTDLLQEAESRNLDFSFEGSVGGGIPIIQPLKQALAANKFSQILGIVNGTTNYILSKMTAEDADFADTLREAQGRGYAEPDPTNDIEGYDAQYKTAILSSYRLHVPRGPGGASMSRASPGSPSATSKSPRNSATSSRSSASARTWATPCKSASTPSCCPKAHPLASVNDVYNAVFLHGDAVGRCHVLRARRRQPPHRQRRGRATSSRPPATSAGARRAASAAPATTKSPSCRSRQLETNYYVRLLAHDRPKVLASLASIFGDFDVSIESVVQRALPDGDAEIVWITHRCLEANFRSALDVISRLEIVSGIQNWIRVEE